MNICGIDDAALTEAEMLRKVHTFLHHNTEISKVLTPD